MYPPPPGPSGVHTDRPPIRPTARAKDTIRRDDAIEGLRRESSRHPPDSSTSTRRVISPCVDRRSIRSIRSIRTIGRPECTARDGRTRCDGRWVMRDGCARGVCDGRRARVVRGGGRAGGSDHPSSFARVRARERWMGKRMTMRECVRASVDVRRANDDGGGGGGRRRSWRRRRSMTTSDDAIGD